MKLFPAILLALLFAAGCTGEVVPDSVQKAQDSFKLVQEGDRAAQDGDFDVALEKYEAALKLTPNAPKFRFAYSQILYWKGLTYDQESHHSYMKTLGKTFDPEINKWIDMPKIPTDKEKNELMKKSAEDRRESLIYFNKSLQQLAICDAEWKYAVEAVPFAMGIIYVLIEEHDKAKDAFERVASSSRVSDEYRNKVKEAMKKLEIYRKEAEARKKEEKPFLPEDR